MTYVSCQTKPRTKRIAVKFFTSVSKRTSCMNDLELKDYFVPLSILISSGDL